MQGFGDYGTISLGLSSSWGRHPMVRPQSIVMNNPTRTLNNSILFSNEQTRNSSIDLPSKLQSQRPISSAIQTKNNNEKKYESSFEASIRDFYQDTLITNRLNEDFKAYENQRSSLLEFDSFTKNNNPITTINRPKENSFMTNSLTSDMAQPNTIKVDP